MRLEARVSGQRRGRPGPQRRGQVRGAAPGAGLASLSGACPLLLPERSGWAPSGEGPRAAARWASRTSRQRSGSGPGSHVGYAAAMLWIKGPHSSRLSENREPQPGWPWWLSHSLQVAQVVGVCQYCWQYQGGNVTLLPYWVLNSHCLDPSSRTPRPPNS